MTNDITEKIVILEGLNINVLSSEPQTFSTINPLIHWREMLRTVTATSVRISHSIYQVYISKTTRLIINHQVFENQCKEYYESAPNDFKSTCSYEQYYNERMTAAKACEEPSQGAGISIYVVDISNNTSVKIKTYM